MGLPLTVGVDLCCTVSVKNVRRSAICIAVSRFVPSVSNLHTRSIFQTTSASFAGQTLMRECGSQDYCCS